jgi:uncharacterized protein YuzE
MIRQSYDLDADALYVKLTDQKVAHTAEVDEGTLVDLDADGNVVGIEVLQPQRRWPLDEILNAFRVSPGQAHELRTYFFQPAQLSTPAHPDPQLCVAVS